MHKPMISGMKVISVLVLIFAFCPQQLRTIVAAIKNAGGKVRYTEYADVGHIIWPSVVKETELLPWLFAQQKIAK